MKKRYYTLLALALTCCCGLVAWADNNQTPPPPADEEEIVIKPTPPIPIPTPNPAPCSLTEEAAIRAYLSAEGDQIRICFAEEMGLVEIYIEQSGAILNSYICNTCMEPTVTIDTPTVPGDYILRLETEQGTYLGYFSL
ncbi:MAG: hypothetical protein E7149_04960 [Rikenellaceae bacterium]|nr:hypothetical protein [Rikenellaceae bacterium]